MALCVGENCVMTSRHHQVPWNEDGEFLALKIHTGTFKELHENKHIKDSGVRCGQERRQMYTNFYRESSRKEDTCKTSV
jgi:hypothetical protein